MYKLNLLPPDDLPPTEVTQADGMLHLELEQSIGRCFYESCDRISQALLNNCQWYLTEKNTNIMLVIDCPDIVSYWHIVSNLPQFGNRLERLTTNAKIKVYPPFGKGEPLEISVNEIAAYRDWL